VSHFTKVSTANIVSKDSFIAACKELGYKDIKENAPIRGWSGRTTQCDVAVTVPNSKYDFGIQKNGSRFDLIAEDFLDRKILGRVVQMTTKHTILAQYRLKGFIARVTEKADQSLHITLTR